MLFPPPPYVTQLLSETLFITTIYMLYKYSPDNLNFDVFLTS